MSYLLSLLLSLGFAADSDLAKLKSLLAPQQRVRGQFEQVRKIKDLKVALKSSGNFEFKLPLDLKWEQKKPFVMNLEMHPDKVVQQTEDGKPQVITAEEQPIVFAFSKSFLSIFSGDQEAIKNNFDYTVLIKGKHWQMNLVPKESIFKKAISKLDISGSEFVETIEVQETSGNLTHIKFLRVKGG